MPADIAGEGGGKHFKKFFEEAACGGGGDAKESRARVTCESHGYQTINLIIGVFYKGRSDLLLGTGLTSKSEMRFRTTQQAMGKTPF